MTDSSALPARDPDGTIETTSTGAVIRFERRLAHPVPEVWAAVTEPARIADWWLPFAADITVDLRPGGQMVMSANGDEPVTITCEILRVEPPVLLEHTHVDPGSRVLWELEPNGDGCVLRLSHFVPDAAAAIDNCYA
ncbi:MAG TPA: SRPBCC family protein, partial [Acidimicrobiales bacterium]